MFVEDKSPDPDEIHSMLLKSCALSVAKLLSIIFQKSYENAQILSDCKLADIMIIIINLE